MFSFDLSDFDRVARRIADAPDQIRFAAARSLNDGAERAMDRLASETWPRHIDARNPNFLKAALSTRGERADKRNLRVVVYDRLGRASLNLHDRGGPKVPRRSMLAIPTSAVPRSSRGVPKNYRPANLKRKVVKGNLIFQAQGRGKNTRLVLMYKLQPVARIKADVPLRHDFARYMQEEVSRSFPRRFKQAVLSRRAG